MMKHMQPKPDSAKLVDEFLARGGKITQCPPQKVKEKQTRPCHVVEIVVDHLPPELRHLLKDN